MEQTKQLVETIKAGIQEKKGSQIVIADLTKIEGTICKYFIICQGGWVDEKGYDKATGKPLVEVDPKYFRPAEVDQLLGNPAKAKAKLGWNPQKTSFEDLVKIMVKHDMKFVKKLFIKAQMEE